MRPTNIPFFLTLAFCLCLAASARAQDQDRLSAPEDMLSAPSTAEIPDETGTEIVPPPATEEGIKESIIIEGERRQSEEEMAEEIMKATMEKIRKLPPAMQKEILDEADRAYANCVTNTVMMNFYDCSCYALTIAGERFDKGPEETYAKLVSGAKTGHCVSAPLIAGYVNEMCQQVMVVKPVSDELVEQTCGCVIKEMIKSFRQYPAANMTYVQQIMTEKIAPCYLGTMPR